MPSTWTQDLLLQKPATGELAGSWGDVADANYDTLDTAICGNLSIPMSASTQTLNTGQTGVGTQPSAGVNRLILWTGPQTAPGSVTITPNTAEKIYYMQNQTTGGFAINFLQGSGSQIAVQPGYTAIIYCDGTGNGANVKLALDNPQFNNVLVQGTLTVNGVVTSTQAQTFTQPVTFTNTATVALNGATTATTLTVNAPGYTGHAYDLYYRSAAGNLVPLPISTTVGQCLGVVAGPALGWTSVGLVLNVSNIVNSNANAIYFASPGSPITITQDSLVLIKNGTGIGVGTLPTHSLHVGISRLPEIWLDANNPSTQTRQLVSALNGTPRWQVGSPQAPDPNNGTNTGSDFLFQANNDAGAALWPVMNMTRASGNVTIGALGDQQARLTVQGGNANQTVLFVRGAASQNPAARLQAWQTSAGATVAYIDVNGNFWAAGQIGVGGGAVLASGPNAPMDLTVNAINIPGCSITLPTSGTYLIIAVFVISIQGTYDNFVQMNLFAFHNAGIVLQPAINFQGPTGFAGPLTGQWLYTGNAGDVVYLAAQKSQQLGGYSQIWEGCSVSAILV